MAIKQKRFFTSPIYYVNSKPHLGHLYTSFAVDILSKFAQINGDLTFCSYGTDEHGQKVESASGGNPQAYVDEMHLSFVDLLHKAEINPNYFVRTSSKMHKETAKMFWKKIYDSGFIYEGVYEGWYSKRDEAFYKDEDVKDGIAIETGAPVEWMKENCLFFALSKFKDELFLHYTKNPDIIKPKSQYLAIMSLLRSDMPDLAVSRSRFTWGIPIPDQKDQIMYVWVDALANYLTVLGWPKNQDWANWWANVVHIIGKDILRFHAIYWPAFLKAAGLPLPKRIFAHGWWKVEGQKMSKSLGNVVDPTQVLSKYGTDELRYFLFREAIFGQDGSFSEYNLKNRINTELVNELGNLVQRVLKMIYPKFGSTIVCEDKSAKILDSWNLALQNSQLKMAEQDISGYLAELREAVIKTNQYIDFEKPWASSNQEKILGVLCLCLQRLAILTYPIIPKAAKKIGIMLGIQELSIQNAWDNQFAYPLDEPKILFTKWD